MFTRMLSSLVIAAVMALMASLPVAGQSASPSAPPLVITAYNAGPPIFRGLYEDNDPKKRLLMVVNYNTDISQYWEWSGRGLRPFDETNEAYKLGVNYVIYGLTH